MTIQTEESPNSNIISVGIREFKNHLSNYLRQVKAGKTIELTERGKPIGRILPREVTLKEKLEAMQQAGLIQWSGRKLEPIEPIGEIIGERSLSDIVIENRE